MIARIKEFTLMDDDFMTRFFDGDNECTQFVLRTILGKYDLLVTKTVAQKVIKSLKSCSVRLDVFAKDSDQKLYDIEIQRADEGAGARRARYRGNDPIGDLMHDFSCKNSSDMKNTILADKIRQMKENEQGVQNMCKIMEDFAKEEREEAQIEMAEEMLKEGSLSLEKISQFSKLPLETVQQLAKNKK